MSSQEKHGEVTYQSPSVGQKHGSYTLILAANKALRQPKVGDIWLCQEGAVLVFGISDIGVEYLWQDTPYEFVVDSRSAEDWHKNFNYKENIFDCEGLKDDDPKLYKEIKEQKQMFESLKKKEAAQDPVNHPSHYTSDPSGIECIQITRHRNFNIGNAIKYLWRAGLKDGNSDIQDLQKAVWYIQDEIERLQTQKGNG
ncbi:DUF3310 domain-containing protein [Moraxella catarrhalis]|uniref:DUF3310 domain-containing protein n=1 Tax=Moraxella catarrhalis TaxID=480 RepID=UPI0007F49E89|nr:DUF3310 domain-containing protein [Moraxella catarrhalis]OAV16568.1 hypothetical protein AO375_0454 [Moraxella catarrhalis]